ncbi:solute carrier family 25 member 45 isoform X2 [Dasypus novemcinctus]|uniref:solute carrier family 25 member 45 isoform X2 n=1 Tax=Dasypus novemcinctus TaxID=9361 RepID=UPI00265DA5DC|nr:solute carrier family 25 member 45 isoform X3 [Dasypus novemcinctus]
MPVEEFVAGWISGALGLALGHPFDTIKVRLQTQTTYRGIVDCAVKIYRHESVGAPLLWGRHLGSRSGLPSPPCTRGLLSGPGVGGAASCPQGGAFFNLALPWGVGRVSSPLRPALLVPPCPPAAPGLLQGHEFPHRQHSRGQLRPVRGLQQCPAGPHGHLPPGAAGPAPQLHAHLRSGLRRGVRAGGTRDRTQDLPCGKQALNHLSHIRSPGLSFLGGMGGELQAPELKKGLSTEGQRCLALSHTPALFDTCPEASDTLMGQKARTEDGASLLTQMSQ